MIDNRIRLLFRPASVAIVGASSNPEKASGYPLRNLLAADYPGRLYPINPNTREIGGVKCYASISELPEAPDLAIVMLDSTLVPGVLDECGRKGVKAVIVGAAGFSEAGEEGISRQDELTAIARRYAIRICGPNCHGVYNILDGIPLGYNFSFGLRLPAGPLAIASQSGALLGSLATRAARMGQGLSYLVTSGNEADLDLCDYLEFFLEDEKSRVVALLIEALKDGPRFLDLVSRSHAMGKTVVVLKVGKSELGSLTTLAHSSRMAGSAEIYEAAFRQFGVISTDTVEAFLGAARMAATQPLPRSGKLMVLTSTGAGASLMADKSSEYAIELAQISEETRARIPARKSAILANPFDTAGESRSPGFLRTVCEAFAGDPLNDCLLLFLGPLAVRRKYALRFCEAAKQAGKPAAAIVSLTEEDMEEIFRRHEIPLFDSSTDACFKVFRAFIDYGRFRRAFRRTEKTKRPRRRRSSLERIFEASSDSPILPYLATKGILTEFGLESPEAIVVSSYDNARAAARKLRRPVILKGLFPNLAHKDEAGLVSRKISEESEIEEAFDRIARNARTLGVERAEPQIAVEKYIAHDYEFLGGIKYDSTFGPALLFGLGGVFTEVLKDYSMRLAPVAREEAAEMVSELKAFPVLEKAVARGTLDLDSLVEAILRISEMAIELDGRIAALDLNPLVPLPSSRAMMVLDAKIHLRNPRA